MSSELKLSVKIEQIENRVVFHLSGAINETFSPFVDQLAKQIAKMSFLEFNLGGISMINSSGTREWTKLIAKSQHVNVFLSECPKVFIDQVNTVDSFLTPNCTIKSFYVPYFCEDNGVEKNILIPAKEALNKDGSISVSEAIEADGMTYSMDVIESKYFLFLKKFT